MICRYEIKMEASCPVNGFPDHYDVIVERPTLIEVEKLIEIVTDYTGTKAFQEQITITLAERLEATVTTIGYHYGVKTTCIAP